MEENAVTLVKTGVIAFKEGAAHKLIEAMEKANFTRFLEFVPATFPNLNGLKCDVAITLFYSGDDVQDFINHMAYIKYVLNVSHVFAMITADAKDRIEEVRQEIAADQIVYMPLDPEQFSRTIQNCLEERENDRSKKEIQTGKPLDQKKLGAILVENKVITPLQLKKALEFQKQRPNTRLGQALLSLGYISEEQRNLYIARQMGADTASPRQYAAADLNVVAMIPELFAKEYHCIALEQDEDALIVAMPDVTNLWLLDNLRAHTDCTIIPVMGNVEEIDEAIQNYYSDISSHKDASALVADLGQEIEYIKEEEEEEVDEVKAAAEGADKGIVKLVNMIIANAVRDGASDIHIEPQEKVVTIRYRVDGRLRSMMSPPKPSHQALVTRIKILSELNIAERRLPQDGQMKARVGHKEVDLRVSVLPSIYGEKVVLRILDKEAFKNSMGNLGFSQREANLFDQNIRKPYGMIIVTGPTGSGKSTTLYTALHMVKDVSTNIISVEDPVEYHMDGITQVQIKSNIGLTFGQVLRSILRQDPDKILVGEIRDEETADIAIKMALTGHMVFSTLHTNDAASSIARFIDIGVPPMLLASALNLIIAQRLVRKICPKCKTEYTPEPELTNQLNLQVEDISQVKFYKGEGCGKCHGAGYFGRMAIFEILECTNEIRKLILKNVSTAEIQDQAAKDGLRTLRHSGLDRVLKGDTTIEEVMAATTVI